MLKTGFTETQLAAEFFKWAWNTYPELRKRMIHVPNEVKRAVGESKQDHIRRIMELRAVGVVKGAWDYFCFPEDGTYSIIELKVGTNQLSTEQEQFALSVNPVATYVCWTLEEAQAAFISVFRVGTVSPEVDRGNKGA